MAAPDRRYFGEQNMDEFQKKVREAAHNVRSPLTTIAGFADLIASDGSVPEPARSSATTIVEESRRLSKMLDAFFDEISPNHEG